MDEPEFKFPPNMPKEAQERFLAAYRESEALKEYIFATHESLKTKHAPYVSALFLSLATSLTAHLRVVQIAIFFASDVNDEGMGDHIGHNTHAVTLSMSTLVSTAPIDEADKNMLLDLLKKVLHRATVSLGLQ